ncbi:hypothetical protein [Robinsoniella sp. RHS]|uniref:hypothetical protein n=1 Tax=Robinsoniella sp. RHS TaxID=1504536 RepID=UPI00064A2CB6
MLVITLSVLLNIFMISYFYCNRKRKKIEAENRDKSIRLMRIFISHFRKQLEKEESAFSFDMGLETLKFFDDFLLEEVRKGKFSENGVFCIHGFVLREVPEVYQYYKKELGVTLGHMECYLRDIKE